MEVLLFCMQMVIFQFNNEMILGLQLIIEDLEKPEEQRMVQNGH